MTTAGGTPLSDLLETAARRLLRCGPRAAVLRRWWATDGHLAIARLQRREAALAATDFGADATAAAQRDAVLAYWAARLDAPALARLSARDATLWLVDGVDHMAACLAAYATPHQRVVG